MGQTLSNKMGTICIIIGLFASISEGTYTDYIGAGHDSGITATAYHVDETATGQKTIDGSGLTGPSGTHSTQWNDHWCSWEDGGPTPQPSPNPARGNSFWIEYDFGEVYELDDMWVWNYNEETGRSLQNVIIDYSTDGSSWTELGSYTWPQASGSTSYAGFDGPDFGGENARYVLITTTSNYGDTNAYGLAEVKFNIVFSGPDTTPPNPDPAAFTSTPSAISDTAISMTATGFDPSGPVEYFFDETSGNTGGTDSGWQTSASYTDTGLSASTQYTYTVQMRDTVPNTGTASAPASATTQSGGGSSISITNPSFESGTTGWSGATTSNSEFYSPVDGTNYATRSGGSGYTTQLTGHTIGAGDTYTLTVWARSTNAQGTTSATNAEVRLYYGSTTIDSVTQDVNPVRLSGAPDTYPNDDGGNVWLDNGYRMEFSQDVLYQLTSADPLYDTWNRQNDSDYEHDMAVGPVITPEGLKALYNTYYEDSSPFYSEIWVSNASGSPPDYSWSSGGTILSHSGSEDPWVIDAHCYYDSDTSRLWMSWGGGTLWVSELDPSDGELIAHPSNPEFDTHSAGAHTEVAYWDGDEWSSSWFEGPALYKHNGYWYVFGSYGNLGVNYTIRGGRGTSPTGPFYDKEGVDLTAYDSGESEYGNSIFLGHDGGQTNPGHPHIWQESGKYYMGYDYVEQYSGGNGTDTFGIRRLYWVNDWPTIWTPITVTFNADNHPDAIGEQLGIAFRNTGSGSEAAFDNISLTYSLIGDMNDDDEVDFIDFSHFALQWMNTSCGDCSGAELTGDGNVDANDLDIFTDNWLYGK